ncbi:hypothetical protein [Planctomycetes bacterium K23_9]|uniref:hypothetical protein n=1 Tax=Stieleria marina TaxID=1930275 RepID=UPI0011A1AA7D
MGSPSAVDQFRRGNRFQETAYDRSLSNPNARYERSPSTNVRQVAMLQQDGGFRSPPLPESQPGNFAIPGGPGGNTAAMTQPRQPGQNLLQPQPMPNLQGQPLPSNPNASLPSNPALASSGAILSPSDMAPMPRPNLGSAFATVDNCNCVSPASGYSAASGIGCGSGLGYISPASCNTPVTPGYLPQNYGYAAPAAQIPGPAVMPVQPGFATGNLTTGSVPRALISLGQQNYQVQVGQGLWGQPVAYVPGQSIRNWVRYFFP